MGLGVRLDECYEPIACMMHNPTDTDFTPVLAMPMIVLQDNDRLCPALACVLNISGVKIAVVAAVSANRTDAFLLGQQPGP